MTMDYDHSASGADGDTYIQFNEALRFQADVAAESLTTDASVLVSRVVLGEQLLPDLRVVDSIRLGISRQLAAESLTTNAVVSLGPKRSMSQNLSESDSAVRVASIGISTSSTLAESESVNASLGKLVSPSQSLTTSAAVATMFGKTANMNEMLSPAGITTDSVTAVSSHDKVGNSTQSLTTSDAVARIGWVCVGVWWRVRGDAMETPGSPLGC